MLSVLLLILKIIGITIAVILGLLLLLVLIVLFVAVKYKGIAVKQGDDIRAGFFVTDKIVIFYVSAGNRHSEGR